MIAVVHPLNWHCGWSLILIGFAAGAILGIGLHRDDFLGGYGSFRRRIIRLGHIALVALGALNVLFSISVAGSTRAEGASILFLLGAITMPSVCFLTGWKGAFRHLFFIPVTCLIGAVVLVLMGGLP